METGIAHETGPGEEALTDINLLKLRLRIPTLRVKKYDKKAESRNGADWEWWIGSSRDKRWIQLRVQAKRSSHAGLHYSSLGYDVARREARDGEGDAKTVKQFDALIAQSAIDGAIPLHVFCQRGFHQARGQRSCGRRRRNGAVEGQTVCSALPGELHAVVPPFSLTYPRGCPHGSRGGREYPTHSGRPAAAQRRSVQPNDLPPPRPTKPRRLPTALI
ncbi:DUF6615 family protein [Prescottella equi]|uniref:DUF6615 family protein n=1 Tax=Rhodococcus hoagii TaxID=43767 RepID=UPI003AF3219B